ncbi:MAG: hypothetical protein RSD13_02905 [Clostridium sp.]
MKIINKELLLKDYLQMKEFHNAFKFVHGSDPNRRDNIEIQERALQYMEFTMDSLGVEYEKENKKI